MYCYVAVKSVLWCLILIETLQILVIVGKKSVFQFIMISNAFNYNILFTTLPHMLLHITVCCDIKIETIQISDQHKKYKFRIKKYL